jgi:hypothetical protein
MPNRRLVLTYAIPAGVWLLAGAILGGILAVSPSGEEGAYRVIMAAIGAPIPITLAIWLLLRVAHIPRAFPVSLLGTAAAVALLLVLVRAEIPLGETYLPLAALLLPAMYLLFGWLFTRTGSTQTE